ncbi:hypothetical protein B0H13DRAFT_2655119 [Mycena leptocephala]|nr:hypothetical protein B0H13DRAFT_2655119 [Mycena leptocephala]
MKFTTAFLALLPLVYAVPAHIPNATSDTLSSRALGVFVCTDPNFTGTCAFLSSNGECVNIPPALKNSISSFGPEAGEECFVYLQVASTLNPCTLLFCLTTFNRDTDCLGPRIGPIVSGGIGIGNPPFPDDAIESFQCFATE